MAILRELLRGLPLVAREGDPRLIGPTALVWPEERAAVERAVAKRQNEYFATRHLARLALSELAVPEGPIVNNQDRSPRWPAGVVGSLTHTDSWCGVAVAKSDHVLRNVGVDMERMGSVSPEVARRILTGEELAVATSVDVAIRFSAKEAFYKAIYPFVRRYVGFSEAEIWLRPDGVFDVRLVSERLADEAGSLPLKGLWSRDGGLCCTAVIVE